MHLRRYWLAARSSLWLFPGLVVAGCGILAIVLIRLDRAGAGDGAWAFGGDASAARSVLSTIAGSLITIAGLTFTITMVVLQLASSQFSPRVLRNFLGDRVTQATAGAFVGIFLYALIVLRSVRTEVESSSIGFVPALSVTVGIGLATVALVLLLAFVNHVSKLIQVSGMAARIAASAFERIDELLPDPYDGPREELNEPGEDALAVYPDRAGYVVSVHLDSLLGAIDRGHAVVEATPGDFVTPVTPLARLWAGDAAQDDVRDAVVVDDERDAREDLRFPIRQLADIALRSVSPALNDPTTAVMCIGYLRALVSRIAGRALPPRSIESEDGGVKVVVRRPAFNEFLEPFGELAAYSENQPRVREALDAALAEIEHCALRAGATERAEAARMLAAYVVDSPEASA